MKKFWENTYVRWAATFFCAGALLVMFYQIVANYTGFKEGLSAFFKIISPFVYGFVMAYLLSPIYNFIIRKTYPGIKTKTETPAKALTISKIIATIVSLVVLVGMVVGLMALLIPQLVDSIKVMSQTLPSNLDHVSDWVNGIVADMENTTLANNIREGMDELQDNLLGWVQNTFLPGVGSFMQRISASVVMTIKTLLNIIIGVIACVYFLNGKERFRAQFRKLALALLRKDKAEEVFHIVSYTNKTFGSFITGKIIDSIIIGILCFMAMSILRMPYPILISTIVGVTNIIPFFGPFIGAIPSIAIILLTNPIQAIWFLVLIIVLQQLDGNIIGPAILGNSVGIASFWVMFAIIIGGGLFGFVGMVVGVPVFAVLYYYFGNFIRNKLRKKGLSQGTVEYMDYNQYGIEKSEITENERTE